MALSPASNNGTGSVPVIVAAQRRGYRPTTKEAGPRMDLKIETLTVPDLQRVDELMKRNSATLGFLPREALRQSLDYGHVWVPRTIPDP